MPYRIEKVAVRNVYLDNENPRHDPIDNEPEIIAYLMAKETVRPLAEDIAAWGLSPLERMAVTPHPRVKGSYVTLEGNRRFCSLKLLNDPEKAPTPADKKAFQEARSAMQNIPKDLEVVIFDSRDDARHWLRLRHGGEQGGKGTKQWKAAQKTRFEHQAGGAGSSPNQQALSMIDYARSRGFLKEADAARLSITTLTRYLSNPSVRDALALNDHRTMTITAPQEQFDVVVKRFLSDALDGTDVHSRTSAADRKAYAAKLRKEKVTPADHLDEPIELNPATGGRIGEPESKSKKRQRDNLSPDKRRHVIPSEFTAKISNKVLKRLYDELKSIETEEHTFATAYLLRAFIEQLVVLYLKQNRIPHQADLHVLVGRLADYLQQQGGMTDRDVKPFRVMANQRHSTTSPETLGAFVHGSIIPTRAEINRTWDSIEPLVGVVLQALK